MLVTERIRIRQFTRDDISNFYAIWKEPNITRYIGDGSTLSFDESEKELNEIINNYPRFPLLGRCAIEDKANKEVVGWALLDR